MIEDKTQKNNIWQVIWDIIKQIIAFIIDFLFNWEDEPYEDGTFLENEKQKHSIARNDAKTANPLPVENNSTVSINNKISRNNLQDYETLKKAFGTSTADYIVSLRQEVEYLVKTHGLVRESTLMMVIPPEKMRGSLLSPEFFEANFEMIYPQFGGDVILKPGNVRIVNTKPGALYAEVQIIVYSVTEDLPAKV